MALILVSSLALALGVLFETPATAVLVAGGAVSVPVIIHLLNRRRFKVVSWAAMRFLLTAQKKNSRRMRLEQLLLLLVRCSLLLLLILAMLSVTPWAEAAWRWCFPEAVVARAGSSQRTHKVLVIDGSFSMDLRQGGESCFSRAVRAAEQIIEDSSGADLFSVVLLGDPPRRVVAEPSENAERVLAELRRLHLPHGNADLPATLAMVDSILQDSPTRAPRKEVYFLTDLQQSTWVLQQPASVAGIIQKIRERGGQSYVINVGGEPRANLAVTSLELRDDVATTRGNSIFLATIQQHGPEQRDRVKVRLLIGKARASGKGAGDGAADEPAGTLRQIQETEVRIERGQETPVAFSYRFPEPGEYVVQVQIENDLLTLDDTRTVVLTVKDRLPVLLVNGKPFGDPFDQATGWLRLALNPFGDRDARSLAEVDPPISLAQLNDEADGDLSRYDCVFLCDVPSLDPAVVRRLERYLRQGGGVVVSLGSQVQPGEYNQLLYRGGAGLLPVPLVGIQEQTGTYNFQPALEADSDRTRPLSAFRGAEDQASLLAARFRSFYRVGETATGIKPRRVLSLVPVVIPGKEEEAKRGEKVPPGGPAILEWNPPLPRDDEKASGGSRRPVTRTRGRVVLVTTTLNTDWTGWPASPSFPAFVQELLTFTSAGRVREQELQTGEPLELYLDRPAAGLVATVRTPDDRTEEAPAEDFEDASVVRWVGTDHSGLYRMTLGEHPREYLHAVNVPILNDQLTSECNLQRTTAEELRQVYPEWDLQIVTDPREVVRRALEQSEVELIYEPLGTTFAHWLLLAALVLVVAEVVLAWYFAHHSTVAPAEEAAAPAAGWKRRTLRLLPGVLFLALLGLGFVLGHAAWTGDFLGFLPEGMRRGVERWVGVPEPAVGEDSHWRLDYSSYLWGDSADPWVVPVLAVAALALVLAVYRREGKDVSRLERGLMVGLRAGLLLLLLVVFLPQVRLWFEKQGWPEVVVLVDSSHSMSAADRYTDPDVLAAAQRLGKLEGIAEPTRLQLAQVLLCRDENAGLEALLRRRKVRVHIYQCSSQARRLEDVTDPGDAGAARAAIRGLSADPENDSSRLGSAVRQVINDFRGSSLAAIVMLTDGVTTEGEDLVKVARYASQMGVPLHFVGLGDAHDVQDVYLDGLRVEDTVYVNDRLVFELRLIARGYPGLSLPVTLHEKGKEGEPPLDRQVIQTDPSGKPVKVQLAHEPKEPGEKVYVIRVPAQEGEVERDNNLLERQVTVLENKQIKVLYVEGYRRYEYHYIKTLLERESQRIKGNKTIDLRIRLMEADPDFAVQDQTALSDFPTRKELEEYDVVLLGDVDPRPRDNNRIDEFLTSLAEFVTERGGGLLVIAGERYTPQLYRASALKDVLPIEVTGQRGDAAPDRVIVETYRPQLTPAGRIHPIFRFSPDEKENEGIWNGLKEMYWYAEDLKPKRAAEVLAVHPRQRREGKKEGEADTTGSSLHPLAVQQFVGAGRSMFLGFHETWRWGFREDMQRFNQFWIQVVRYLARSRLGRIDLRLDRQTTYRRGDPIKVLVRFPDDRPPPPEGTEVRVVAERRPFGKPGDVQVRTLQLGKVEGSRATYEAVLTQTPEGEYRFWLSLPATQPPQPRAECKVVAPPGEMYGLRLNDSDLILAAEQSGGKYHSLATVEGLMEELPEGQRVSLSGSSPPWLLWNHVLLYLLALLLLTTEWLLRKQKNLL